MILTSLKHASNLCTFPLSIASIASINSDIENINSSVVCENVHDSIDNAVSIILKHPSL